MKPREKMISFGFSGNLLKSNSRTVCPITEQEKKENTLTQLFSLSVSPEDAH